MNIRYATDETQMEKINYVTTEFTANIENPILFPPVNCMSSVVKKFFLSVYISDLCFRGKKI